MKSKHLLLTLLMALVVPWAANAQTRETQTFDFEDGAIPSTWTNDANYPWVVVSESQGSGHSGTYCIKSGNSGVSSSSSTISATFNFNDDGTISFLGGCWGEGTSSAWDKCIFSIDGTQQFAYGARQTWETYTFNVTAGEHTFTWSFTKDSSVNADGDAFFVDDIVVDLGEVPVCPKPTGLDVTLTPGNGTIADLAWTENGEATSWQICLNGDETNLITATTNPYQLTGLTAETAYTAKVRAYCDDVDQSAWSNTVSFTPTNAYSITVNDGTTTNSYIPIYYSVASNTPRSQFIVPSTDLTPILWASINKLTFYNNLATVSYGDAEFAVYVTEVAYTTMSSFADWTTLTNVYTGTASVSDNKMVIEFSTPYSYSGGNLLIGFYTNETGTSASYSATWLGTSGTSGCSRYHSGSSWGSEISASFLPKMTIEFTPGEAPSCLPPTNLNITSSGQSATLTWESDAEAWDVAYALSATASPDENIIEMGIDALTYTKEDLTLDADHYFWVRTDCGDTDREKSAWVGPVSVHIGYCLPAPSSVDGSGITNVTFGVGENVVNNSTHPTSSPFYGDYSAQIGAVQASVEATVAITTSTSSYPYGFLIWVDLDNSLSFEDSEIVYMGQCSSGSGTLNATFTIPATQATGDYRMRIGGADSYFDSYISNPSGTGAHSPCNSGTYCIFEDYTLRVLEAPSCLPPTGLDVTATGLIATLTWESDAEAWDVAYSMDNTADPSENIIAASVDATTYTTDALTLGDYYFWVRTNCSATEQSLWAGPVSVHIGYCTPNPSNVDGNGISNVTFGVGDNIVNNDTPKATYADYSSQIGAVQAGVESTIAITYATGYDYGTIIWVDLDNSLSFEDSEIVYTGTSGSANPTTLNAAITIPATQTPGDYMMRIGGADSGFDSYISGSTTTAPSACYTGNWACFQDYTLRVLAAPSCMPLGTLTYDESNMGSSSVVLSWTLLDDTQTAWQVCVNGDETNLVDADQIPFTLPGLEPETAYTVKVRANCGDGDYSMWSNEVSFTTPAACPIPTNVAATNLTQNTADITWIGSSDVDSYNARYRVAATISDDALFSEDFEDGIGEWTMVSCASSTGLNSSANHTDGGSQGFRFYYNTNPPQYLVSPELTGITEGAILEFYYKNYSSNYPETFKVGYSTTTAETDAFTFGDEVTASDTQWHLFSETVATGTKYICIQYTANNMYYLYIDDILIAAPVPAGSWTVVNAIPSTSTTLSGLTANTKYDVQVQSGCNRDSEWSDVISFTTLAEGKKVFATAGNWGTENNWVPAGVPALTEDVIIRANATIESGIVATANNITFEGTTTPTLTIADGGQLQHNNSSSITATVKKNITGYGADNANTNNGYVLLASPLSSTSVAATDETYNIRTGNYDLYSWSRNSNKEWAYRGSNYTSSVSMGRGDAYLYASQDDREITFTGYIYNSASSSNKYVYYTAPTAGSTDFSDWNLIGNPFVCNAYLVDASTNGNALAYYKMNAEGNGFEAIATAEAIAPMEGVFYQAEASGYVYFVREMAVTSSHPGTLNINVMEANTRSNSRIDNAIIRFGEGNTLGKFMLNENSTKVYIPQNGKDYAVVNAGNVGEMPVNFKAESNGSYTLSFSNSEVTFSYLHLIDNMTGADVDLLATPSYTFDARYTDYASRFRLVFATGSSVTEDSFGFVNANGNLSIFGIEGTATLQVIDVTGRILSSETFSGSYEKKLNAAPGVYMLRLINGNDVKVQKIVVR